ncbi:hypothetical protein J5N97_009607 [Dioscorea zingiberensis]|uniref:Uncharacterized protein n=1 Tax=Dioscorea zingiberensis TaxID=325984 RepID=A0A9D5CYL9_9LILI|nr:hypothetical protein J5N97_009607 [Dioscorea zingiberensis]
MSTTSIGRAKLVKNDEVGKELQCALLVQEILRLVGINYVHFLLVCMKVMHDNSDVNGAGTLKTLPISDVMEMDQELLLMILWSQETRKRRNTDEKRRKWNDKADHKDFLDAAAYLENTGFSSKMTSNFDPECLWRSPSFTNQDFSPPPPSPPAHEHDPFFFQFSPPFFNHDPFQDLSAPLHPTDHVLQDSPQFPQDHNKPLTVAPSSRMKRNPKRTMRKDHHGKIHTMQGLRDRRMRLSLEVAHKFFGLQDMLGFDKASKTLDWLLTKSHSAIKDLMESSTSSECTNASKITHGDHDKRAKDSTPKPPKRAKLRAVSTRESRAQARARARERIKDKRSSSMHCGNPEQDDQLMKLSEAMDSVLSNQSSKIFNGTMCEWFPWTMPLNTTEAMKSVHAQFEGNDQMLMSSGRPAETLFSDQLIAPLY